MDFRCRENFITGIVSFLIGFFVAWLLWSDTLRYVFATISQW